jgi:hypothetical protein
MNKEKVVDALIRTFKKLREQPHLKERELIGLFINFIYDDTNNHSGMDTYDYSIMRKDDYFILTPARPKPHFSDTKLSEAVQNILKDMKSYDFYSFWLRSSFEDPKNEKYTSPFVKNVISVSEFMKDRENHYTKYLTSKTS